MRRDILLDSDGNRVLVAGDYAFADGVQAVKQGIEVRVRLFLKEVWTDQALGVDYLGRVLIHAPDPLIVKSEISRAIAATPDVSQVVNTSYIVDGRTREAVIGYTAASTEGNITGSITP